MGYGLLLILICDCRLFIHYVVGHCGPLSENNTPRHEWWRGVCFLERHSGMLSG